MKEIGRGRQQRKARRCPSASFAELLLVPNYGSCAVGWTGTKQLAFCCVPAAEYRLRSLQATVLHYQYCSGSFAVGLR